MRPESIVQPVCGSRLSALMLSMIRRYFYLAGVLLIIAIVVYGFSHTIGGGLLHPQKPPPAILYIHALVSSCWLALLLVQSSLVRLRQVRLHRLLGYAGLVLGAAMPVITLATRYVILHLGVVEDDDVAFSTVTFNDMLCFTTAFALAMAWRKQPEYHRRLIYIAACCLTVPAFARMPETLVIPPWWYLYGDALIALGMLRDLIADRRVHRVYWIGLPSLALCQSLAMALYLTAPASWVSALRWLLRL